VDEEVDDQGLGAAERVEVRRGGDSDMSDSWIAWKPRIDDPSKLRPSSKTDWSNEETGTVKCCMIPGRSQKRTSTIATPSSLMYFSSSSLFWNIRPPWPQGDRVKVVSVRARNAARATTRTYGRAVA
jgi:hypothetical protein